MQTLFTLTPPTPDSPSTSWESGLLAEEKATGQPQAQETWMAVVETMVAAHSGFSGQASSSAPPATASAAPSLTTGTPGNTADRGNDGQEPFIQGTTEGAEPAKGPEGAVPAIMDLSTKQFPAPVRPGVDGEQAVPEFGENHAPVLRSQATIPGFEKTALSAAQTDPEQKPDTTGAGTTPQETVAKNEEALAARPRQPNHGVQVSAATHIQDGAKGHPSAHDPSGSNPSTGAPIQSPSMLPPDPPSLVSTPGLTPQPAEKPPSADLIASLVSDRQPLKRTPQAGISSQQPAPAGELSDNLPAKTDRSPSGRYLFSPHRAAAPANSAEISQSAETRPQAHHPPATPAIVSDTQPAASPKMAAALSSTDIRDDMTLLRIEHPLWTATGTGDLPVSENRPLFPNGDPPPATREMRILSDVIEKAYWHQENGQAQARIQIKPALLGQLQLNILTDHSRVAVEIRVENRLTREFIEMNLQTLKTDLQDAGLEIDKINVIVDPDMDNPREQHRESARKQSQRFSLPADMAENPANQHTAQPMDNLKNSINYFA
jgi:hypothetical protein